MSAASGPNEPALRQANKRGTARLAAVQALYQMDIVGTGLLEIAAEYEAYRLGKEVDGDVYREADAQWFRAILFHFINDLPYKNRIYIRIISLLSKMEFNCG